MIKRIGLLLCFGLVGCATHSPDLPIPTIPSAGENGMHSGVYAVRYNALGRITAQVWYPETRDVYNALIARYGSKFVPSLKADDHLTKDGAFWDADDTAISAYIQLLTLKRQDRVP